MVVMDENSGRPGSGRFRVRVPDGEGTRETKTRDEHARRWGFGVAGFVFRFRAPASCSETAPAVHPEGGTWTPATLRGG